MFTSFIFGVTIVPSPCSMSVQAMPRQPSSPASASPTGPPPTIRTGRFLHVRALLGPDFASLCLEARELHHLGPLVSFLSDKFREVGGRAYKLQRTEFCESRLQTSSVSPALISLLRKSTIPTGVFLGAPTPNQVLAS